MTQCLQIGTLETLAQNIIYALPPCRVLLFTDATTPTIQQSETVAFTANVVVTLTAGQAELAGGFVRCTSGTIGVTIKKM